MPILFVCPTESPQSLVPSIEKITTRLDGIMSALRGECLQGVSTIYREIATKDTPVLTDLLHEFNKGEREDVSDLRLDFPDIPEEAFEGSPETWYLASPGEPADLYDKRLQVALGLAKRLGKNVLIVAPVHAIRHLTGVTICEGEVLPWSG